MIYLVSISPVYLPQNKLPGKPIIEFIIFGYFKIQFIWFCEFNVRNVSKFIIFLHFPFLERTLFLAKNISHHFVHCVPLYFCRII